MRTRGSDDVAEKVAQPRMVGRGRKGSPGGHPRRETVQILRREGGWGGRGVVPRRKFEESRPAAGSNRRLTPSVHLGRGIINSLGIVGRKGEGEGGGGVTFAAA